MVLLQSINGSGLLMPPEFCSCRSRLSAEERRVYDILCRSASERRCRAEIPEAREIDADKVLHAVLRDQSMLFYLCKEGFRYTLGSRGITVSWEFTDSDAEIGRMIREIDERLRKLPLLRQGTQLARELRVHDLIQSMGLKTGRGSWEDHCIAGPLLYGRTVCEGTAQLFRLLCCMCGVHSICVFGSGRNADGTAPHSWNLVRLGNICAHVDAYWDCLLRTGPRGSRCYTYFNLSDRQIGIDHTWTDPFLPPCPEEKYSYFVMRHAAVNTRDEYRALLRTAQRRQRRGILARLGPALGVAECMQEVMAFPWGAGVTCFTHSYHDVQRVLSVWMERAQR